MSSLPSEQKGLISLVDLGRSPDRVSLGLAAFRPYLGGVPGRPAGCLEQHAPARDCVCAERCARSCTRVCSKGMTTALRPRPKVAGRGASTHECENQPSVLGQQDTSLPHSFLMAGSPSVCPSLMPRGFSPETHHQHKLTYGSNPVPIQIPAE